MRLYDLGITDDFAYLVMEYFSRGDLRAQMSGPLAPTRSLGYALEIATALDAIHHAGILHRDLKPGNVMVRDDGSLALIDFGLAKHRALELEITDKGLIFGTPHYMSPEQGHGQSTDARSDLYSLGVVLYELLTGAKPFDADNPMAIIYQDRPAAQARPTMAAFFAVGCIASLSGLYLSGWAGLRDLWLALFMVPGMLAGYAVSRRIGLAGGDSRYRAALLTIAGIAACVLIWRGLP